MDLEKYKFAHKLSSRQLAKLLDMSPQALCNYLMGRRCPNTSMMMKIKDLTSGKVKPEDLIDFYYKKKSEK